MRFTFIILTSLAAASPAWAAESLTLRTAVRMTLQESSEIQSAMHEADAAEARHRQAKGHRLPSVDLYETFSRTDNPAEVFALTLNQERFDMESFFMSDPNSPDAIDSFVTRLEVTQPVYTGGKLGARIGQAEEMSSAQRLTARHIREKAVFETITAYTGLIKAQEYLDVLLKARATTMSHVELAEAYAGQGIVMDAEVLRAKVHLAEVDELIAKARSGVQLAQAALSFHMGVDQAQEWKLEPIDDPPPIKGTMTGWLEAALTNRRDLEAGRRKLAAGRLEERVARSAFLPEVAVVGRYDLYDDTLFGSNGGSGSLMAVAKINLYRGGSDTAARSVSSSKTRAFERNIERFEEGVRLEVRQAWQELETAKTRHSSASGVLNAARESVRVSEHRFKQGLEKMVDLLDAETALREAELRELVARYDVALSTRRLQFAAGETLIHPTEES